MLDRIKDLPPGISGLTAAGRVSREDYEQVFVPLVDEARRDGRRLRFVYHLGPAFEGFTPGATWDDVRIGLRSTRLFDGVAIVSDVEWIRRTTRLVGFMMPCPVRTFSNKELTKAVDWLRSLPEGPGVSHRLIPETGVIVVEVKEALRVQDFEALELTADQWIEAHGPLRGLVIHARSFPGWEDLVGFLRHVQFVKDHHRKIRRIAVAVDSKLASVAPRIAEHFVHAEIVNFAYDDLAKAIEWAGA